MKHQRGYLGMRDKLTDQDWGRLVQSIIYDDKKMIRQSKELEALVIENSESLDDKLSREILASEKQLRETLHDDIERLREKLLKWKG